MKRVSRRAFFEWLSPRPTPGATDRGAPSPAASGFSLEAFYAARGPQELPPITMRPSVLHHAGEPTSVGCPPPHSPPNLEGDSLYAALAERGGANPREDDEPSS
jgi:hypothetical protein